MVYRNIPLHDDRVISFPDHKFRRLEKSSDADLARVRIRANGSAPRRETIDEDISVEGMVNGIFEDATLTNMAAFHCQQAIEKTLKSILEQYEAKVPRIHNIITLKAMIEPYLSLEIDEELLALINDVYTYWRQSRH